MFLNIACVIRILGIGVIVGSEALGQGEPSWQSKMRALPRSEEPSFAEKQLTNIQQRLIQLDINDIGGINEAKKRLKRPECAKAVGGDFNDYVETRLFTVTYYTFATTRISAEQQATGNIQVVFAHANSVTRSVLVFEAFMTPNHVLTRLYKGGAMPTDLIPYFEFSHGLKQGSLTIAAVQMIVLLHEHAHLNGAIVDDIECLVLSMLNTRHIVQACAPELLDNPPSVLARFTPYRELFLKLGAGVANRCIVCHIP